MTSNPDFISLPVIDIELNSTQCGQPIDEDRLIEAVRAVLTDHGIVAGSISLAVVDDKTIHDLNRRYLEHDYPTDVLSFPLYRQDDRIEAEVIVSVDTAAARAEEIGWPLANELLLYVIHGALHLVGFLDHSPADKKAMRAEERRQMARWGIALSDMDENIDQPTESAAQGQGGER